MTRYKIEVRNSPRWRQHNAATLGVSITSPNWQDEKFESILEFAAANFSTIRIDVTDALYRHNFMAEGMREDQALAHANSMGALWLAQHADAISASPVKPVIVRWAEWYKHPDYSAVLQKFQDVYDQNTNLQEAIHKDIIGFHSRKHAQPSSTEYEHSKNYLLEELAVITLQARELPSTRLYPGDQLNCLRVIAQGLIPEAPKGLELEQFAKIKFDKRDGTPGMRANPRHGKLLSHG
jgi:tRNA-dependent cyclodipeptide synthase